MGASYTAPMLAFAFLACSSASPPTIRWDGAAVSVDDVSIGAWATACPGGSMGCSAVRDALRVSSRRGPDRTAQVEIPGDRPWEEAARLLMTASDAGHAEPDLAIDGRAPVRTSVPDPKWLAPGTMVTLIVAHDDAVRWIDGIAAFEIGDGATCATVYAGEPDLQKICEGALGTDAPASVHLGGSTGCLVPPAPLAADPQAWNEPLTSSLGRFAGSPSATWVIAADGTEPTAVVGAIATAAAAAKLPPVIPALAVLDGSQRQPTCEDVVRDKRALDEAEARSIGAGTAAVRLADGTVKARATEAIARCVDGDCGAGDSTFEDARFVQIVDGSAGKRWLVVALTDGSLRGFACDAAACEPHRADAVQERLRGAMVTVGHRRPTLLDTAPAAAFGPDVVTSLQFADGAAPDATLALPFGSRGGPAIIVDLGYDSGDATRLRFEGATLDVDIDGVGRRFVCDAPAICAPVVEPARAHLDWTWRLDAIGSDPPAPRAHITAITAQDPP